MLAILINLGSWWEAVFQHIWPNYADAFFSSREEAFKKFPVRENSSALSAKLISISLNHFTPWRLIKLSHSSTHFHSYEPARKKPSSRCPYICMCAPCFHSLKATHRMELFFHFFSLRLVLTFDVHLMLFGSDLKVNLCKDSINYDARQPMLETMWHLDKISLNNFGFCFTPASNPSQDFMKVTTNQKRWIEREIVDYFNYLTSEGPLGWFAYELCWIIKQSLKVLATK